LANIKRHRKPSKESNQLASLQNTKKEVSVVDFTNYSEQEQLLKLEHVIGNKKKRVRGYVPMSKSKWYAGIKSGIFPPALRIGSGSFWRLSDIRNLINKAGE
jgi:predicted DNA-binding transcriptional regulator AlpA